MDSVMNCEHREVVLQRLLVGARKRVEQLEEELAALQVHRQKLSETSTSPKQLLTEVPTKARAITNAFDSLFDSK